MATQTIKVSEKVQARRDRLNAKMAEMQNATTFYNVTVSGSYGNDYNHSFLTLDHAEMYLAGVKNLALILDRQHVTGEITITERPAHEFDMNHIEVVMDRHTEEIVAIVDALQKASIFNSVIPNGRNTLEFVTIKGGVGF